MIYNTPMNRKINCVSCKRDCGEIRDATLLKNLKFICDSCVVFKLTKAPDYGDLFNGSSLGGLFRK